jgi:1,4-dihydroxy-2-naphthoyl-CoA hydrolase
MPPSNIDVQSPSGLTGPSDSGSGASSGEAGSEADAVAALSRWRRALETGFSRSIGLELQRADASEVSCEWIIDERHLQPGGVVHGGVYSSVVETCCSIGALLAAPAGMTVVGVENHTSFVRAVRGGRLSARAVPLQAGRRAALWECNIWDEQRRLIATGRLRLLCVAAAESQER